MLEKRADIGSHLLLFINSRRGKRHPLQMFGNSFHSRPLTYQHSQQQLAIIIRAIETKINIHLEQGAV